ncbi:MAG TPA: ABC transporter permease [Opitutaceae bacterium]|jgi:NitT/TauT family transport system permease protein
MNRLRQNTLPPLVAGGCALLIWYGIRWTTHLGPFLLPLPHEILEAAWRERHTLAEATAFTFAAAFLGFVAAAGIGFLLSLFLSWSVAFRRALMPFVLALQMTPVIILTPFLVLWMRQGLAPVVTITFIICFFPVVANTTFGFTAVDRNLVDLFQVCGASRFDELLRLRVPSALPHYLTALRIAASLAPIGAVTGDFLAGSAENSIGGLGFMTITYFAEAKTAELLAAGLTACLMGFIFVGGVHLLHWWALHAWHDSARRAE